MIMHLVRDVLDKKLLDREDEEVGRVDGLVMQLGEIGGATLGARIHPRLARLSRKLARVWGPKRPEPVRIPWSRVVTAGRNIKLDVKARETGAIDWEVWIARHVIERIPGGGSKGDERGD
jgi:sporulation protein YlmC with PRC-barrel domain